MTRENKAGLAVAGVFLTLVGTVGVIKWRDGPNQRAVTMSVPAVELDPEPPKAPKVTPRPVEKTKPVERPKPAEKPAPPSPGAMPEVDVLAQLNPAPIPDSPPPSPPPKDTIPNVVPEGKYEYVFQGPPAPEKMSKGKYEYVFQGPPAPPAGSALSLVKNETTTTLPAVPGADSAILPLPPAVPAVPAPPAPEIVPPAPIPQPGPSDLTPSPSIVPPKASAAPLPAVAPPPLVAAPPPPAGVEPPKAAMPPVPGGSLLPPIESTPPPPVPPAAPGKVEPVITPPAPPPVEVKPVTPSPTNPPPAAPMPTNPPTPAGKGPAEKTSSGTPLEGSRFVPAVTLSPPVARKDQPPMAGGPAPKIEVEPAGSREPVKPAASPTEGLRSIAVPTPSDLPLKPVPSTPPAPLGDSRSTLPVSTLPSARTNVVQIAGGAVSAAPAAPKVTRYDTQAHVCKPADTWESISAQHLLSKNWADALRAFNMSYRGQSERVRGNGVLQAGDMVFIPPAAVLEANYPTLIRK